MDPTRLLLRMMMWVRRPPSRRQAIVIGIAVGLSLLVVLLEWLEVWPKGWRLPIGAAVRALG